MVDGDIHVALHYTFCVHVCMYMYMYMYMYKALTYMYMYLYRVNANKMQDLISTRKFAFQDFS